MTRIVQKLPRQDRVDRAVEHVRGDIHENGFIVWPQNPDLHTDATLFSQKNARSFRATCSGLPH